MSIFTSDINHNGCHKFSVVKFLCFAFEVYPICFKSLKMTLSFCGPYDRSLGGFLCVGFKYTIRKLVIVYITTQDTMTMLLYGNDFLGN